MKGSKRVIEYLNQSIRHELTAVNQYWLHYRLLEDWGYTKLAAKEREESLEEMVHADNLIKRTIFLGGHPNLQTLNPLMIGTNLKEVLECDLKGEHSARALYKEAREACEAEGDYVTKNLFEQLLADEEGHIDFLETQLELFEKLGEANYGLLQAEGANEVKE